MMATGFMLFMVATLASLLIPKKPLDECANGWLKAGLGWCLISGVVLMVTSLSIWLFGAMP